MTPCPTPAGPRDLQRQESADDWNHEQRRWATELAGRWRDGSVQVDGVAIPARLLTHDDADVGVARFVRGGRGVLVVAEGIDLDRFVLVGLVDPAPLVDEFELRRRRIFPQPGG